MKASHITSLNFYQRKRESILYRGMSEQGPVFIKCIITPDPALRQAFFDEYRVMHSLSHPGIPAYYGMIDEFPLPDRDGRALALCMEDCLRIPQLSLAQLSWPEVTDTLSQICDIVSYLLDKGVLYTDLNPTNILINYTNTIIKREQDIYSTEAKKKRNIRDMQNTQTNKKLQISLVDYTCCYFFLENPYPEYSLRFSYNLSPRLKGQQLLIQELSLLLQELIEERADTDIPSGFYQLLEAGKNPPEYLSLSEYASMIRETHIR